MCVGEHWSYGRMHKHYTLTHNNFISASFLHRQMSIIYSWIFGIFCRCHVYSSDACWYVSHFCNRIYFLHSEYLSDWYSLSAMMRWCCHLTCHVSVQRKSQTMLKRKWKRAQFRRRWWQNNNTINFTNWIWLEISFTNENSTVISKYPCSRVPNYDIERTMNNCDDGTYF